MFQLFLLCETLKKFICTNICIKYCFHEIFSNFAVFSGPRIDWVPCVVGGPPMPNLIKETEDNCDASLQTQSNNFDV